MYDEQKVQFSSALLVRPNLTPLQKSKVKTKFEVESLFEL